MDSLNWFEISITSQAWYFGLHFGQSIIKKYRTATTNCINCQSVVLYSGVVNKLTIIRSKGS